MRNLVICVFSWKEFQRCDFFLMWSINYSDQFVFLCIWTVFFFVIWEKKSKIQFEKETNSFSQNLRFCFEPTISIWCFFFVSLLIKKKNKKKVEEDQTCAKYSPSFENLTWETMHSCSPKLDFDKSSLNFCSTTALFFWVAKALKNKISFFLSLLFLFFVNILFIFLSKE